MRWLAIVINYDQPADDVFGSRLRLVQASGAFYDDKGTWWLPDCPCCFTLERISPIFEAISKYGLQVRIEQSGPWPHTHPNLVA